MEAALRHQLGKIAATRQQIRAQFGEIRRGFAGEHAAFEQQTTFFEKFADGTNEQAGWHVGAEGSQFGIADFRAWPGLAVAALGCFVQRALAVAFVLAAAGEGVPATHEGQLGIAQHPVDQQLAAFPETPGHNRRRSADFGGRGRLRDQTAQQGLIKGGIGLIGASLAGVLGITHGASGPTVAQATAGGKVPRAEIWVSIQGR